MPLFARHEHGETLSESASWAGGAKPARWLAFSKFFWLSSRLHMFTILNLRPHWLHILLYRRESATLDEVPRHSGTADPGARLLRSRRRCALFRYGSYQRSGLYLSELANAMFLNKTPSATAQHLFSKGFDVFLIKREAL